MNAGVCINFKLKQFFGNVSMNSFTKKGFMKRILPLVFLLFWAVSQAQVENRATLHYTYFAPSGGGMINSVDQSNVDFSYFMKSKVIAKKVRWDNKFSYRSMFFDGDFSGNFHDLDYTSTFVYTKNMKNFIIGNARLNFRSEMSRDIGIDAVFPALSAGYMRQSQTNRFLRWGLGMNYNNDFGRHVFIPFVLMNYENSKIRFNATLPTNVLLMYKKEKANYGFHAVLIPAIFQADSAEDEKIKMLNVNFFAFSQFKLADKLWLDVKPGITIRRDLTVLDSGFNVIPSMGENRIDLNFVITTGLLYRM